MIWLWETHLKEFPHIRFGRFEYRSASIFGNEDCPSRIELYRKLEPSYRNKPSVVFERDDETLQYKLTSPTNVINLM
jgi:hypothetical protein